MKTLLSFITASLLFTASANAQTVLLNQGEDWNSTERHRFYSQDQGSRIMPFAWMKALKTADGKPFLGDGLARYGYLPNPASPTPGLPVGFVVANEGRVPYIGMTCSACHTRDIEVNGTNYRVDGGPAFADLWSLFEDMNTSTKGALAEFDAFADGVLGAGASDTDKARLKVELENWSLRYSTLVEGSKPEIPWGPARADAIGMIFNRLTGLDLGTSDDHLIPENIQKAEAPARYPFLWNAARQDKTQWPGFADNGNDILGLARNVGEVYGVFGTFFPTEQSGFLKLNRDYITQNSVNFDGLKSLEDQIWKIGVPQWPWEVDDTLAKKGARIYNRSTADGGCTDCHGIETGAFRSLTHTTWKTPIQDVGTDRKACATMKWSAKSGVLEGAKIPVLMDTLGAREPAVKLLAISVLGSIIQHELDFSSTPTTGFSTEAPETPPEYDDLSGAFDFTASDPTSLSNACAYESRVMEGIWAAAPYLHNGSVPTLAALLEEPENRPASFKVGPEYDLETIGLAVEQPNSDYTLETTGCDALDSGHSRCGHSYGTQLSDAEKAALLEYLKTL